jgi:hypothetical protein
MSKYTLELTEQELDYLDNFIHDNANINDYYDVGTFKISVFAKICDLCEYSLGGDKE